MFFDRFCQGSHKIFTNSFVSEASAKIDFGGNLWVSRNEIASVFAPAGLGNCKFNTDEVLYVSCDKTKNIYVILSFSIFFRPILSEKFFKFRRFPMLHIIRILSIWWKCWDFPDKINRKQIENRKFSKYLLFFHNLHITPRLSQIYKSLTLGVQKLTRFHFWTPSDLPKV